MRTTPSEGMRGLALVCLALGAMGCNNLPGKPKPLDETPDFEKLYQKNCAGCHGADGTLGPAPPLNDPLFRALIPEDELGMTISMGRPGTPMTAFAKTEGGSLTPAQIHILVCEIKGFPYKVTEKREGELLKYEVARNAEGIPPQWGVPPALPSGAPSYFALEKAPPGKKTKGAAVFARACADCHGDQGEGMPPIGAVNDVAFLSLMSDAALRRLVITGRPDLGMPDYAGKMGRGPKFTPLTSSEINDLVAHLAFWRQGSPPDGK